MSLQWVCTTQQVLGWLPKPFQTSHHSHPQLRQLQSKWLEVGIVTPKLRGWPHQLAKNRLIAFPKWDHYQKEPFKNSSLMTCSEWFCHEYNDFCLYICLIFMCYWATQDFFTHQKRSKPALWGVVRWIWDVFQLHLLQQVKTYLPDYTKDLSRGFRSLSNSRMERYESISLDSRARQTKPSWIFISRKKYAKQSMTCPSDIISNSSRLLTFLWLILGTLSMLRISHRGKTASQRKRKNAKRPPSRSVAGATDPPEHLRKNAQKSRS